MKRLLLIGVCLILWAVATSVSAQSSTAEDEQASEEEERGFSHRLEGHAVLASGEEVDVNMLIGFQRSQTHGWYFRAGPDYIFRQTPPSAYYLNIILDGNGLAYVLEFSDKPIKTFSVTIEGYELELMPTENPNLDYGMRLRLNERQLLFDTSHPRLRLVLNEDGLQNIVTEGTLRDLSTQRAE